MMEMFRLMSHFVVMLKVFLVVPLSGASIYNGNVKTGNMLYWIFFHCTQDLLTNDFIFSFFCAFPPQ